MDTALIGFAVAAGAVAAFNPCGFAMLPAYLSLVVLGDGPVAGAGRDGESPGYGTTSDAGQGMPRTLARALAATVVMAAGFVVVFGGFGLLVTPLASRLYEYLPAATMVIGAVLIGLGGWLLAGRQLTVLLPKLGSGPTARLGSMFGYGIAYALASLSCTIGPFLAVTGQAFSNGSFANGVAAFIAYGLGMTLVVGALAVGAAVAGSTVASTSRKILPHVNRISGALLMLAGAYVLYYGWYEQRLQDGGDASDPVIDLGTRIQGALAGVVDSAGTLTIAGVLTTLAACAVVWARVRRPRRQRARDDV